MTYVMDVPDDFWGMTIEKVKSIVKKVKGVRLTNKDHTFNNGLRIESIGRWRLKSNSRKALRSAVNEIKKKR